jgi:hypothetical protein
MRGLPSARSIFGAYNFYFWLKREDNILFKLSQKKENSFCITLLIFLMKNA